MKKSAAIRKLVRAARAASRNAYAPYSHFRVGAALRGTGEAVFTGANVENASYGLTICAERAALASAVSAGCRKFKAIAIVSGGGESAYPCGACLQVLAEFGGPGLAIYLATLKHPGRVMAMTLGDLLPRAFRFKTGRRRK